MKILLLILCLTCLWGVSSSVAQPNFREAYEKADPIPPDTAFSPEEKLQAHQMYLEKANQDQQILKQLYGHLYLFTDHIRLQNFAAATEHVLAAEALAQESGVIGWKGWVSLRRGILMVYLKNYRDAIPFYQTAAEYCAAGQDSLCLAESWEQLSAMYGRTGDYQQANTYFEKALPLLLKFGKTINVCTALTNYANLLALQERPADALPYYRQALTLHQNAGDKRQEALALNNMADSYCQLRQFQEALSVYRQSIDIAQQHQFPDVLVFNYQGMATVYETMGDMASALTFYKKFHYLRDSTITAATQLKIGELEVKFGSQQKELALQKSQAELAAAHRSLEKGIAVLVIVFLIGGLGVWRWWSQIQRSKQELYINGEHLRNVTRMLLEKNTLLSALEAQNVQDRHPEATIEMATETEENLYNKRILTDADWADFKIYFENAHPGYLLRLRKVWPALSEAEERLFLFIKLNLTSKEIAAMLGISTASVKKTRHRLRKRLALPEEDDLEKYIQGF